MVICEGVSDVKTDWNWLFRIWALSLRFATSSRLVWDSREPVWTFSVLFLITRNQKEGWGTGFLKGYD